ncbi:hypothetical protein G4B88_024105 [Cannabis sativa]|uniref:Uncharacterized protein n=1 Tax=Cannabis sativa TaxID=3483 RepID=A0A7J6EGK5_CANSA|nr:hypothetical protein G4B88_024105 [Cannabis sativa]
MAGDEIDWMGDGRVEKVAAVTRGANQRTTTIVIVFFLLTNNSPISHTISAKITEKNKTQNLKSSSPLLLGGLVVTLLIAVAVFVVLKKKKTLDPSAHKNAFESSKRQFSYSEIITITNNFERILGKGGSGTVYHGLIDDNTQVAVKVLFSTLIQVLLCDCNIIVILLCDCNPNTQASQIHPDAQISTLSSSCVIAPSGFEQSEIEKERD